MKSAKSRKGPPIDKVRASREGHAYHEAWAARVALELLVPSSTLTAIALENFSIEDAAGISTAATQIADLVRYRGAINVESASAVEILQFKYSIASASVATRAGDLTRTLVKFAQCERDFLARVGRERLEAIVKYEFVTNRPFHSDFTSAIDGLQRGDLLEGAAAAQAQAIRDATGLPEGELASFLRRLTLTGSGEHISQIKAVVHRTLADWSGASDALTRIRLAGLCALVRDKAGAGGQHNNLIGRVDVLAALEIAHENELFPAPDAFPAIGITVDRPIADQIVAEIDKQRVPLLIHAPGGMGKTVLMQVLAHRLDAENSVVLFDCFGAGQWRDPADARHLSRRALPHMANLLAGRGLCDLLIPPTSVEDLLRSFRLRLEQAVNTLRHIYPQARVVLLLDGIDHSALQADETHSDSFAQLFLKSMSVSPIEGVALIASCRTERLDLSRAGASCCLIKVPPFTAEETAHLVQARESEVTFAEITALHSRSGGNPRVLDALLRAGRPYDAGVPPGERSSSGNLLDELLQRQIEDARREAVSKGVSETEVNTMLAGLALLPPPVPPTELAVTQALPEAAIESFASDLAPLLDRTPHGLVFRDEPTESLIRRLFRNDEHSRQAVIGRLNARQTRSSYAARALPLVLASLNRTDDLVNLAFDARLPEVATSRVAQRAIRLSRLTAALVACTAEKRTDDLAKLLLEATRVAGGHERSDWFLQLHPDLVAISGDPEAMRRLFEAKTGWPGARHAALAVAHAFAGELGEASRNARRAFGWLEWRSKLPEHRKRMERARSGDQDRVGPAYILTLSGNMARVALWIDGWPEDYAHKLFCRIVDLLERHSSLSPSARARRDKIIRQASHCRLKSRALAAALLQHADLSPKQELRLLRRLAQNSAASDPAREDWSYRRREAALTDALLCAATKGVRLGLHAEASAILDSIGLGRLRLTQFGSYWSHNTDVERCILAAALRAALENRSPNLMDIAPFEIVTAIPARKRATPEAFEAAIQALLHDSQKAQSTKRKRSKTRLSYQEREEASRTLTHRVRPLMPYVIAIAQLLQGASGDDILSEALNQLNKGVTAIGNYPYRNGPQYIARTGFDVLLTAADALALLSSEMAQRLVEWLIQSPVQQAEMWTWAVSILSRRAQTHNAALVLAQKTATLIQSHTDVETRIDANGTLARAIWRASHAEAQAYFRRGLDVADAIGSDDYSRIAGLAEFASYYSGAPLPQDVVHTFSRVCELNIPHDTEKFAWRIFGQALSRIGGLSALAIVSRLADREIAALSWSLPPLLTALVENGCLDAKPAAALIGLSEPNETFGWCLADFAELTFPKLQPAERELVASFILREIDRQYLASPPKETLDRLLAASETHLQHGSLVLARLRKLRAQADELRQANPGSAPDPPRTVLTDDNDDSSRNARIASIDPGDPEAIDAAIAEEQGEKTQRSSSWVLARLLERAKNVDEKIRFLRAIVQAKLPSLADKLWAIGDQASMWREQSTAIRDELPRLALELAELHAQEITSSEWESSYALSKLIRLSGRPGAELVPAIINALRDRAIDVSASTWLEFACMMAKNASAEAIRASLERFLANAELPDDLGDGPWQADLEVKGNQAEIVAGLVWFGLGCPDASNRWRAAHAVRRLGDLGCADILSVVVGHLDTPSAMPFQNRNFPFFSFHAQLWLLIAIARLAGDHPEMVVAFRTMFEDKAFDQDYPHVLVRHFAASALKSLATRLERKEREKLSSRLASVNSSPFPTSTRSLQHRRGFYASSGRDAPEPANPFHFDYDFSKYEIDALARVFGCDHSTVESALTTWIRRWSSEIRSMWECPRSAGRSDSDIRSWGGAAHPARDTFGGHLAWHALMLSAGELLKSKAVVLDSYKEEPWVEWISGETLSTKNGLWLADGTDFFPPELRIPIAEQAHASDIPSDRFEISKLAGFKAGLALGEEIIVDGSWESVDGIDVSVRSVLVQKALAKDVALAVAIEDPYDQWLPREDDHFHWRRRGTRSPIWPMTKKSEHTERRLDRHDPYGASTALDRVRPTDRVIKALGLRATDPFQRQWVDNTGGIVFRAEAWGAASGEGRYAKDVSGTRLLCRLDRLRAFLAQNNACVVLLVRIQKYLKDETNLRHRRGGRRRQHPFRTATSVITLCPSGGGRMVRRIPAAARAAVATLSTDDRRELELRVEAIHQTGSAGKKRRA